VELVLSQESALGTHKTIRWVVQTGISNISAHDRETGLKTAMLYEVESTRPDGCKQIYTSLSCQTAAEKISRTHNFICMVFRDKFLPLLHQ